MVHRTTNLCLVAFAPVLALTRAPGQMIREQHRTKNRVLVRKSWTHHMHHRRQQRSFFRGPGDNNLDLGHL